MQHIDTHTKLELSSEVLNVLSSHQCILQLWVTQYRSHIYSYMYTRFNTKSTVVTQIF